MTAVEHGRIWDAVRAVGEANAAAADLGDTSTLRHTIRLIEDAIGSLESVQDMGGDELRLSIGRDIDHLRGRVKALRRRMIKVLP